MVKLYCSAALLVAIAAPLSLRAQNPAMDCKADGIVQVCTLPNDSASTAPVPVTPSDQPSQPTEPAAPKVTYKNGQLSISAENVPLADVLHEVSVMTGAKIDIPAGKGNEPVFVNIGPGPARETLVALLNGSDFNYVIAGDEQSGNIESIALTPENPTSDVAQTSVNTASEAGAPPSTVAGIVPPNSPTVLTPPIAVQSVAPPVQPAALALPGQQASSLPSDASSAEAAKEAWVADMERQRQAVLQQVTLEHEEEVKNGTAAATPAPAQSPDEQ